MLCVDDSHAATDDHDSLNLPRRRVNVGGSAVVVGPAERPGRLGLAAGASASVHLPAVCSPSSHPKPALGEGLRKVVAQCF